MYRFARIPVQDDFDQLAAHIEAAPTEGLHPELTPRRMEVVQRLRQMGTDAGDSSHQGAYQALRLFVR